MESGMTTSSSTKKTPPEISVAITAGSIRNACVSVREFLWFFPKDTIRDGRPDGSGALCVLELQDFGTIESDIDAS